MKTGEQIDAGEVKITRHACPHNHDKKFCDSHDFDDHYSQKCGHGCGYSQSDLIDELLKEIEELKEYKWQYEQLCK
jgi:hypothetical protein